MTTDDKIISVVQAHKDGKKIEMRATGDERSHAWWRIEFPSWNFHTYDYRVVAPEPRKLREFWITPMKYGLCHFSEEPTNDSLWHVREVIE